MEKAFVKFLCSWALINFGSDQLLDLKFANEIKFSFLKDQPKMTNFGQGQVFQYHSANVISVPNLKVSFPTDCVVWCRQ
jgi:hypothetical protein